MNKDMTQAELEVESERLKAQQAEAQQRLQVLQQQQVKAAIAELGAAAKKRDEERLAEEAVLAEIAHRRAARLVEEEKQQQRVIEENRKAAAQRQVQADRETSAQRSREQEAARLRREQERLHLLEQAERSLIAELSKPKVAVKVEDKPATLASNPMATILGWDAGSVAEKTVPEISYAEHVATKRKADEERAILFPAAVGPRSVDGGTLASLSAAFFESTGERANHELLLTLLSNYDAGHVTKVLAVVAAQHQKTRLSVSGIVGRMKLLLEGEDGVISETPTPVYSRPAPKELPRVPCPVCAEMVPYLQASHCGIILNARSARSTGLLSSKECEELLEQRGQK